MFKKVLCGVLLSACSLFLFAGCGRAAPTLVNTETLPVNGVESIRISYISERVTFHESTDGNLVVKEYMNNSNKRLFAKVSDSGDAITVTCGDRNGMMPFFQSYIEVYLPTDYEGRLAVETASGSIEFLEAYTLEEFQAESISGRVDIDEITADDIRLLTTSGSINARALTGDITAESTSGKLLLDSIDGHGNFSNISGSIDLDFSAITGDVNASSMSGAIRVNVPGNASFDFSANTTSGSIRADLDGVRVSERSASGSVGSNPEYTLELDNVSGSITIQ